LKVLSNDIWTSWVFVVIPPLSSLILPTVQKQEQELTNGITSNLKVSAHQTTTKTTQPESRNNPQNGRKSSPAIQQIKD
jgi:hypothetical protein